MYKNTQIVNSEQYIKNNLINIKVYFFMILYITSPLFQTICPFNRYICTYKYSFILLHKAINCSVICRSTFNAKCTMERQARICVTLFVITVLNVAL